MDTMDVLKQKIPMYVFNKLMEGQLHSISDIITTSSIKLRQNTKLSLEEIDHVTQTALSIMLENRIRPVSQLPEWQRITSGCEAIDSIIHGGIPLNGITEIVGASGVGKTQLCLQLSLTVQFPINVGGLEKGAVYICTEDTFPSKRLHNLTKAFSQRFSHLPKCSFEDKIFIEHIADYDQLHKCLFSELPLLLRQKNVGLIIIDSIAGIFRSETLAVNYKNRSKEFLTIASKLKSLQNEFNIGIVCVNQVTCNLETGKNEPCLGLAWSNMVTCRFQMSRNELENTRLFKVEFAPDLPNKNCYFTVNDSGIESVSQ